MTIVLGCLQRSQQNYVVTNNRGTSYLLNGVGDQLSGEVGHTLAVKGKLIEPSLPSVRSAKLSFQSTDNRGASQGLATLRVASVIDDVHRLADRCSSH